MKKELETKYTPSQFEDKIYQMWETAGYFKPEVNPKGKPFTIMMPPPNVTGVLHIGHALVLTIQDTIVRFRRMQGRNSLWLPGMDHAGIATQTVVKKKLDKEGINYRTLGREKFIEEAWQWKKEHGGVIIEQTRKMGASCDWTREKFTLDDDLSQAVTEAFIELYQQGLIYRGNYIVNFCPKCATAISDDEVEHIPTKTKLYFFKYDKNFPITIATTRPETKLGDTAVAVNPKDKRYKKFVGKEFAINLDGVKRKIKIISDRAVDMGFGTGALGVTPAHSMTDWLMAEENHLEKPKIIDEHGRMTAEAGKKYQDLKVLEAQRKIVAYLKGKGLLEKEEEIEHNLAVCYRCGGAIEPLPSLQWFVKVKPLAGKAREAVEKGEIQIIPKRFEKIYFHWLDNIRDWCISRQLWWGHRLPVWYRQSECKVQSAKCKINDDDIYVGIKPPKDPENWRQDEDVLDTWFSSALWPFSTLGWPDKNSPDFKKFYPTDVLETAYDILFFWVARMIMFGLYFTNEVPFKEVYIHGLIRDEHGRKMSKSLGNVLNPLDLIKDFGTDALRFSLVTGASPGKDINFSLDKIKGSRNFINKIWNASRFVMMNFSFHRHSEEQGDEESLDYKDYLDLAGSPDVLSGFRTELRNLGKLGMTEEAEKLKGFNKFKKEIADYLENFKFSLAGEKLRDYFWHDFCDLTIESVKRKAKSEKNKTKKQALNKYLLYLLTEQLKLLHPFIPFITEELWQMIWQKLGIKKEPLIITRWPR